ncbi:hypothetical protein QBC36DRAFT_361681 [Triangularia setosa]|uniref:RNase MRP protein 1 RNA binding domain-containing protein n=1 Tax=Triangularia setosa TaxID=2587417 RepID=A0AAN6WDG5_9PEZI|nr:hypothetical protein QBC36DRAFT_361681 [Podospora setosa]
MTTEPPPPTKAISPPLLESSLTTLHPLSQILQSLHHRNKNQHSSSRWWAAFDMLRRNVAKLTFEIEECLDHAPSGSTSSKKGKMRGQRAQKWEEGVDKVVKRARFMKEGVVVKGWEQFGRLVGDRQFAQVGLALVGCLGGVNKVVGGLLGEEEDEEEEEEREGVKGGGEEGEGMEVDFSGAVVKREENGMVVGVDMGVVVDREEVVGGGGVMPTGRRDSDIKGARNKKLAKRVTAEVVLSDEGEQLPKRKKKFITGADGFDDVFGPVENKKSFKKRAVKKMDVLSDEVKSSDNDSGDEPRPQKPAGSKKKKQGGDEFDDIFCGLGEGKPKTQKNKKKKKAAGDEFDDIFGGLSDDKPKKKMNKVGGGDEFDDIFGGLGDGRPKKKSATVGVGKKMKKKGRDEFDDIFAGF